MALSRQGPGRGGADRFIRFFREELIPFIDGNYRTKEFRILAGPQAGAFFALHALVTAPDLFDAYLTESSFRLSPAISEKVLQEARDFFARTGSLRKFFYTSCEKSDDARALERTKTIASIVESRKPEGFRFHLAIKEVSGDFIPAVDLKPALRELFAGYRFPEGHPVGSVADIKRYYAALSADYGFDVDVPSLTMTFEGDRLASSGKVKEAIELFEYQLSLYPAALDA